VPGPPRRRAFVHIGLPKTGTSYLQTLVWGNLAELRAQGLVVVPDPGPSAQGRAGADVMLAARDRLVPGEDPRSADEVLDLLAVEVQAAADADVLLTQEQLVGCTAAQARSLLERFGGREVHVVVTARAVSRQVPSAWQERVKTRGTTTFSDFVPAARDRTGPARDFWRKQDLPVALERWSAGVPPEHVHVVTVPARQDGSAQLAARFFGVLGVDHDRLLSGGSRSNSSLGAAQAELLRRVNVALGERLPKPRLGYARVGRWFLAERFLVPQGGRPPLLPRSAEQWCRQLSEEWVATIRGAGYAVAGDLADLLPDPAHFGDDQGPDDVALLESAVTALADLLAFRHEELARIDELTSRVAELEAGATSGATTPGAAGGVTAGATESARRGRWRGRVRWRARR
jgi:hypothetical protein